MKCSTCKTEGDLKRNFKRREFHTLARIYYVCRRCGKASRPQSVELNPESRSLRKEITKAKQIRQDYLTSVADIIFKILVWGPSAKNPEKVDIYKKREQIRDTLLEKGQKAYFSEDLESIFDEYGNPIAINLGELLQTKHFHLVINIADSQGSLMEAQAYNYLLVNRSLLWLREGQKGFISGLAQSLIEAGTPPLYFNNDDVKSCVMTLVSEDWVHGLRSHELSLSIQEKMIKQARIIKTEGIQ